MRELGGEPNPPFRKDAGSCSFRDIESVKNVDQNVVGQVVANISIAFLHFAWK
jgi:hypothetical protein